MTKLEEARAALAHALFKYSGLGALHINDLRPELDALIAAAKDEEAEEIAAYFKGTPFSWTQEDMNAVIQDRIANRKKENTK